MILLALLGLGVVYLVVMRGSSGLSVLPNIGINPDDERIKGAVLSTLKGAEDIVNAGGMARIAYQHRPVNWIVDGAKAGGDICPVLGHAIGAIVGGFAGVLEQIFGGMQPREEENIWLFCKRNMQDFDVRQLDDKTVSYVYYLVLIASLPYPCYFKPSTGAIAFKNIPPRISLTNAERGPEPGGFAADLWKRALCNGAEAHAGWSSNTWIEGTPGVARPAMLGGGWTVAPFKGYRLPHQGWTFKVWPIDGARQTERQRDSGVHVTWSLKMDRVDTEELREEWVGPFDRLSNYADAFNAHAENVKGKIGALTDG